MKTTEIFVKFEGLDLNIELINEIFPNLDERFRCIAGENCVYFRRQPSKNRLDAICKESAIELSTRGTLMDLLINIRNNKEHFPNIKFTSLSVWLVDLESLQGNGELSRKEIHILNEIGAVFCWSTPTPSLT